MSKTRTLARPVVFATGAVCALAVLVAACDSATLVSDEMPVEPQAAAASDAVGAMPLVKLVPAQENPPIVYVDGIRADSSALEVIDMPDIERIEIVKGDAAKATWGDEAAHGVIQIFTRAGGETAAGRFSIRNGTGPRDAGELPAKK